MDSMIIAATSDETCPILVWKYWMRHLLCFLVVLDSNLIDSLIVHVKCSVCRSKTQKRISIWEFSLGFF